ncbi:MAG: hypothetical protein OEZ22_13145 [Spirochaetia bacterium]|nr:hypothetical protein [Spirochaetia bacterium]
MTGEFLEESTRSGIVIRVNLKKGNYLLFKNNKPIPNPRSQKNSIIHNLSHIIFLGMDFDLSLNPLDKIGFYPVKNNQLHIPFHVKGLSDIRHVKFPAYVESEILPAVVSHFKSFNPGAVPRTITGYQYFITSDDIEREMLVRIKIQFPKSRVIVFRQERDISVEAVSEEVKLPSDVRAVDLLKHDDVGELSKNPIFSARVYLRNLDLPRLNSIPYKFKLDGQDAENIKTILDIVLRKASENADIKRQEPELRLLRDFLELLTPFVSFEIQKVEQFFDKGLPEIETLDKIQKVLISQKRFLIEAGETKNITFFDNALSMLQPLLPEDSV